MIPEENSRYPTSFPRDRPCPVPGVVRNNCCAFEKKEKICIRLDTTQEASATLQPTPIACLACYIDTTVFLLMHQPPLFWIGVPGMLDLLFGSRPLVSRLPLEPPLGQLHPFRATSTAEVSCTAFPRRSSNSHGVVPTGSNERTQAVELINPKNLPAGGQEGRSRSDRRGDVRYENHFVDRCFVASFQSRVFWQVSRTGILSHSTSHPSQHRAHEVLLFKSAPSLRSELLLQHQGLQKVLQYTKRELQATHLSKKTWCVIFTFSKFAAYRDHVCVQFGTMRATKTRTPTLKWARPDY